MKTRTSFLLWVLVILALLASACSGSAVTTTTNSSAGTIAQGQNPAANASLSEATKLAVGMLKLEGTDQAVTADQAATLVTLWQAYQALSNSDTTAPVELEAVIQQIQGAMTPEQVKAIEAMQLTRQSMNEALQALGVTFGPGAGAQGTPPAGQSSTGSGASGLRANGQNSGGGPQGGVPGGGFPAGGGPGGDPGGGVPPDMAAGAGTGTGGAAATPNATAQARMSAQATRVSPMVLNALITLLQGKLPATN